MINTRHNRKEPATIKRLSFHVRSFTLFVLLTFLFTPPQADAQDKITVGFLVGISGLGDQSFNDMAYAGLFKIKKEFGTHLVFEDSEKSDAAFGASMQRLIEKGSDIIVANGFYMQELVEKYARQHPEVHFILQDAVVEGLDNVVCILYSVNEGSFLAGAFAALMSNSRQVGFIGGVDIPIMHSFRKGFKQGVQHISPKVSVEERFISIAPDFSGFKNPSKAHDIAVEFYESGIDIIFSAAGLSGNGVIQAAKETGKFAIGVDSDQDYMAQGNVITSMMKRLDVATYTEVKKVIEGNSRSGPVTYGLAEEGVGLSPMKFTRHLIPFSVTSEIEEIKRDIISGKITVTEN